MGNDDSRRPPERPSAIDAGWDDAPTETEAPEGIGEDLPTLPHTGLADTPKPRTPKPPAVKRDASAAPGSVKKVPAAPPPVPKRDLAMPNRSITPTGMRAAPRPSERKPRVEPKTPAPVTVAPVVVVGPVTASEEAPEPTLPDAHVPSHEPSPAPPPAAFQAPPPIAVHPPAAPPAREPPPVPAQPAPPSAHEPPPVPVQQPPTTDQEPAAAVPPVEAAAAPLPVPLPIAVGPSPVEISYKSSSSGGSVGRVIGAFLVGVVIAGAGAFVAGRMTAPKVAPKTVPTQAVTASTAAPSATASAPATPLALVASGDAEAMKAMQARPAAERVAEESLALARGRASQRLNELAALGEKLKGLQGQPADAATVQSLIRYAKDTETTVEAQRIMATLPAPQAADLIYEVWVGTPARNPTTELAEALVYSKEVRAKASAALAVALDLRAAQTCEEFAAILPRATEVGDKRSQVLLGRLAVRSGCGPTRREDCYACLHPRKTLEVAIRAVMGRPPPRF